MKQALATWMAVTVAIGILTTTSAFAATDEFLIKDSSEIKVNNEKGASNEEIAKILEKIEADFDKNKLPKLEQGPAPDQRDVAGKTTDGADLLD